MKYILTLVSALVLAACGDGGSSEPVSPAPTPPPANVLPVVEAGADQTVSEGSAVSLSGSATDSDGTIASYSWQQISGLAVELASSNAVTTEFTAPQVDGQTSLKFRLIPFHLIFCSNYSNQSNPALSL